MDCYSSGPGTVWWRSDYDARPEGLEENLTTDATDDADKAKNLQFVIRVIRVIRGLFFRVSCSGPVWACGFLDGVPGAGDDHHAVSPPISRRRFHRQLLQAGSLLLAAPSWAASAVSSPAVITGRRPLVANGIASGDVTESTAIIWSRTDLPSRMVVEWDTTDAFRSPRRVTGPVTGPEADFTAKTVLTELPAGMRVFYRVRFEASQGEAGEAQVGSLVTAAREPGEVHFAWSGDTCGQGYGIDEGRGGMRTYEAIRRREPQFFIHSGDTIYADNPLSAHLELADGKVWHNLVTEEKSKVAETLAEFRGNYRYSLLDPHVRRLYADTPVFVQWDDHEVLNNWWPGRQLPTGVGYEVRDVNLLAARSKQAFFDYQPIRNHPDRQVYRRISRGPLCEIFFLDLRTYRGANGPNRQPERGPAADFMGSGQLEWLKGALSESRAVWKIVCSDMPLALMVQDANGFEAFANGDGPPLGRELEIAELLRHLKRGKVRNVVWLTADVHYCASHYYDPSKAQFTDFDGFWEFVSGPLHAGTFGPDRLDNTFGPEVRFTSRLPGSATAGPWTPHQFFGTIRIDPGTRAATVTHFNRDSEKLWETTLEAV